MPDERLEPRQPLAWKVAELERRWNLYLKHRITDDDVFWDFFETIDPTDDAVHVYERLNPEYQALIIRMFDSHPPELLPKYGTIAILHFDTEAAEALYWARHEHSSVHAIAIREYAQSKASESL